MLGPVAGVRHDGRVVEKKTKKEASYRSEMGTSGKSHQTQNWYQGQEDNTSAPWGCHWDHLFFSFEKLCGRK